MVIALAIGGLEASGLLAGKLKLHGGMWRGIEMLNSNMGSVGYLTIALFVTLWILSALHYRRKNYDSLTLLARRGG